jgi:hypothetical protein
VEGGGQCGWPRVEPERRVRRESHRGGVGVGAGAGCGEI